MELNRGTGPQGDAGMGPCACVCTQTQQTKAGPAMRGWWEGRNVWKQQRVEEGPHLQRAPLVVLGVDPRPQGELCDEDLGRLGEQHRGLGADHLHREETETETEEVKHGSRPSHLHYKPESSVARATAAGAAAKAAINVCLWRASGPERYSNKTSCIAPAGEVIMAHQA